MCALDWLLATSQTQWGRVGVGATEEGLKACSCSCCYYIPILYLYLYSYKAKVKGIESRAIHLTLTLGNTWSCYFYFHSSSRSIFFFYVSSSRVRVSPMYIAGCLFSFSGLTRVTPLNNRVNPRTAHCPHTHTHTLRCH